MMVTAEPQSKKTTISQRKAPDKKPPQMKKIIPFLLLLAGYGLQAQTPGEETGKIRIYETEDATAGQCDGTITVEAEGSAGPFWLRVSGPNDFGVIVDDFEGESIVEGLCPGDYTILVTNAYDCEVVLEASVSCTLTFEVEIEHACRPGGGRISLSPAAGAEPIDYQWTGPDGEAEVMSGEVVLLR